MTERDLFLAAIDIPDPAARRAFLDRACGGDPALRRGVDELLAAHAEAGSFLEPGSPDPGTASVSPVTADLPPAPPTAAADPDRTSDHAPDGPTADIPAGPPAGAGAAGVVIGGKYRLVEPIGEGGMGTVFMADQTDPVRRRVAVK
ncbi:MAG: hypothetical protein K2X87_08615, partial [Gemmataceae bacterium]|nr:hypothetical protein [Gemmataceae bacterium]